jgi:hypothetical protein
VIRLSYLSLDPAMRGWMNDARSYIEPVGLGDVMRAGGVGEVIASRHESLAEGDYAVGMTGAQEYAVVHGAAVNKVDPRLASLPVYLSALGMTGATAYFGLLDIGRPEPGDTVVVSGAAGAVGGTVGQIAKIKGARAIGIAGGPEKCRHVVEDLGFDAAIDYKSENIYQALAEHCPGGIDVYFDNVGGDILDAALALLAKRARVVICGAISQYNATGAMKGPSNYMSLLVNNASMTGYVIFHYAERMGEAIQQLGAWYSEGKLTSVEDVATGGIEKFPDTLLRLFRGENLGKLVLEINPE